MAGVPREAIQRHIADGTLTAFEGKIEFGQLRALYPEIEGTQQSMLEILSQIKEDALTKSIKQAAGERDMASLIAEVKQLAAEAAHYKRQVNDYRRLTLDLREMLLDLKTKIGHKQRVEAVIQWLDQKRKKLP